MSRKLQSDADKLQKASEQMNMRPVWEYTKNMRRDNKSRHRPIKKKMGNAQKNLKEKCNAGKTGSKQTFNKTQKTLYQE